MNYTFKYISDTNCLNQSKINAETYYYLRETYGLKSQMSQSCIKTAIAKYKTNKSNGHDFTLVQFKKLEYYLVWNRDYSQTTPFGINKIVGIDLGIYFLATTYDSYDKTTFYNDRQIKSKRGSYKVLRKQL